MPGEHHSAAGRERRFILWVFGEGLFSLRTLRWMPAGGGISVTSIHLPALILSRGGGHLSAMPTWEIQAGTLSTWGGTSPPDGHLSHWIPLVTRISAIALIWIP